MKTYLYVNADRNDADYVATLTEISEKDLKKFMPVFEAIKHFKQYKTDIDGIEFTHHHNWPLGEYSPRTDLGEKSVQQLYVESGLVDEELFEEFLEAGYIPFDVHSIKEISVLKVAEKEKLV